MNDLGTGFSSQKADVEQRPSRRPDEERPGAAPDQVVELNKQRTIGAVLRSYADTQPERPAIVASQFALLSYLELQHQIDAVRAHLRQAGFSRDARIAVAISNSPEAALAIIAIASSAVAVPLDPKLTVAEVERCLLALRPSAVLVLRSSNSAARQVAEQHGLHIIEAIVAQHGKFGLQLAAPSIGAGLSLDDPDPEAPAFILHTSGTTADPNLVPFSHRNVLSVTKRLQAWFNLTPQDRCLNVSPVYYSHALTTTVLPPLLAGGSVAFPANASNVDLSEWLGALKPTWYSAGPTLHLSVLEKAQLRPDARTMHSLRFISSAGAPLSGDVHEQMQTVLGVPVLEHYGSTETAQISTNLLPRGSSKPGTCGIPAPDTVRIVGEDGRQLPPGARGEILVRTLAVMSGYLNAPELNRSAFVDGWFRTGDIGSLDDEGFLSLHGRQKELINRGGEKIAPLEIDNALMRHPDVLQAAAYAVPHPRLGEDVAAAVVLQPGSRVTPDELREFLGKQLATYKNPRRITIVDQLPKGITGKVQRKRLSENPEAQSESALAEARLHTDLLQLWKKYLKTDNVSIDDDFFEKGGDSLLAMELHVEVQRLTGQTLSESVLFEAATVRELAKRLSRSGGLRP
jgi:oxalate---CoA ligase